MRYRLLDPLQISFKSIFLTFIVILILLTKDSCVKFPILTKEFFLIVAVNDIAGGFRPTIKIILKLQVLLELLRVV